MAIDFNKYIKSTTTHWISNSGGDERGKATGGQAGDQTGKEWVLKAWYNRPWGVVLRYPNAAVGIKIAELGIAAALNNHIGYDQVQRKTYWTELVKANYNPSAIATNCEEDCTAGVTANVKAAGHLFGIKKLEDINVNTYSGNMKKNFVAAGFMALTDSKYLASPNYLLPGDILLYEGHHAATNVTYGKYAEKEVNEAATTLVTPDNCTGYIIVERGNYHVRKEASAKSESIGIAKLATRLPYLSAAKDGWFFVEFNGKTGWISSRAGDIHLAKDLTVKPSTWYIRSEPKAGSKELCVVSGGNTVCYLGEKKDGWYHVYFRGVNGWISEKGIN